MEGMTLHPLLDAGHMPDEFTYHPVPLIGFFGLEDAASDDVHGLVWSSFATNRQVDRIPLYFKIFPDDHVIPPPKAKKSSYEWFIPQGILKTNWVSKHLFDIPSVAVVFFDLDFDDPGWSNKEFKFVSKVAAVRKQLNGRDSRLAVVLIQRNRGLQPSQQQVVTGPLEPQSQIPAETTNYSSRAAQLCTTAGIPANCLFVLSVNENPAHLLATICRIEAAFSELSKQYYATAMKVVRSHRDSLNRGTHSALFVRHQFKLAFYSELRHDQGTALKHYKQAYSHLLEMRMTRANLTEVKTIAGFINYKVTKLCSTLR